MMNRKMSEVAIGAILRDSRDDVFWRVVGKNSKSKTIMFEDGDGKTRSFALSTVNKHFEDLDLREVEVEETVPEVAEEVVETVEEVAEVKTKKSGKGRNRTKKSFEELVADIPSLGNIQLVPNSKRTAVHVKRGNKRIFGYSGPVVVVNRKEYLTGLEYEAKNYGYVVAPTRENMLAILRNA